MRVKPERTSSTRRTGAGRPAPGAIRSLGAVCAACTIGLLAGCAAPLAVTHDPAAATSSGASTSAAVPVAAKPAEAALPTTMPTPAEPPAVAAARTAPTAGYPAPAFGIEFLETRLSAAGSMVDLRYRVLDPDKAAPLLDRKIRPVLVHLETGRRYYVPQPPIVGALRQTMRGSQAPQPGRTYFMLFANPDRVLKTGDALALFVGDQRVGEFRILQ